MKTNNCQAANIVVTDATAGFCPPFVRESTPADSHQKGSAVRKAFPCHHDVIMFSSRLAHWVEKKVQPGCIPSLTASNISHRHTHHRYQRSGASVVVWRNYDVNVTSLKTENCYDANFVVSGDTGGCHYDNFRCCQWQKSWLHNTTRFLAATMQL